MTEHPLEAMPPAYWQGIQEFNQQQFYACHDTLEAIWMESLEPEKTFYQGLLQIAVALYHLGNHNLRGAIILLGEGTNRLRRYPDDFGGINLDRLRQEARSLQSSLQSQFIQEPKSEVTHPTDQTHDQLAWILPTIEVWSAEGLSAEGLSAEGLSAEGLPAAEQPEHQS
ncbi:MAG: DUF309 domain-containing protein [Elainella sp. Prado103]|jgi:hypothetical protein|nr:DUF309 domain-containing protein [Elainella sp. Prado103]